MEEDKQQRSLISWAEFIAAEPAKPKGFRRKSQSATASLFERALTVEREVELVSEGR